MNGCWLLGSIRGAVRKGCGKGDTHYISMGRDVLTKAVLFSESVWNGDWFIVKIWDGIQIYLFGKGFTSVWKGDDKLP